MKTVIIGVTGINVFLSGLVAFMITESRMGKVIELTKRVDTVSNTHLELLKSTPKCVKDIYQLQKELNSLKTWDVRRFSEVYEEFDAVHDELEVVGTSVNENSLAIGVVTSDIDFILEKTNEFVKGKK